MWSRLADEAQVLSTSEPMLAGWLGRIFSDCSTIEEATCRYMAGLLADPVFSFHDLSSLMAQTFREPLEKHALLRDLEASVERDPAAQNRLNVFLNHKGFHALLLHRVGHWCWMRGRRPLALVLQGLTSRALAVDIHPAASIGSGVFVDHATGVVIGETAVVGDDVSILQDVTLGGTGKRSGNRHPKVGRGVLICAGSKVLGNISIGEGAKIGAGSVVLDDVPPHVTVVGVPARVVGRPRQPNPAAYME